MKFCLLTLSLLTLIGCVEQSGDWYDTSPQTVRIEDNRGGSNRIHRHPTSRIPTVSVESNRIHSRY